MNRPFPQSSRLNSQKQYARSASEAKHAWLWRGLEAGYACYTNRGHLIKDISGNGYHGYVNSISGSTQPYDRYINAYGINCFVGTVNLSKKIPLNSYHSILVWFFNQSSTLQFGDAALLYDNANFSTYISIGNGGVNYYLDVFTNTASPFLNSIVPPNTIALYCICKNTDEQSITVHQLYKDVYTVTEGYFGILTGGATRYADKAFASSTLASIYSVRLYNNVIFDEKRLRKEYSLGPTGFAARKSTKIFSFSVAPPTSQTKLIQPSKRRFSSTKLPAKSAEESYYPNLWRGLVYAHIPDNGSRSFKDISGNNLHAFVSSTNNLFSLKTVKEYTTIEKDSSDGSTTFSIPIGRANKYHCGDFTKIINFYLENNVKSGPTGRSIYFTISSTIGPGYYSVTIDNDFIDVNMYDSTFTSNLAYNTNSTILWKERDFNSIVITRKKELLEIYVNNIKYPLINNSTGDYGSILIEPRLTLQLIQNAPVRNTMAVVSNRLYNRYFLPEEIAQDYAAGPCGFAIRKPRTIPVQSATVVTPEPQEQVRITYPYSIFNSFRLTSRIMR